jgi:hypothetical protein
MQHEKDKRGGREEVHGKSIRELLATPEGREMPNNQIAAMFGCHRTTVANQRKSLGIPNPKRKFATLSKTYKPPMIPGEGYPDEPGDWQAQAIPAGGGQKGLKDPTPQRIERMKAVIFQKHLEKKLEEEWEDDNAT